MKMVEKLAQPQISAFNFHLEYLNKRKVDPSEQRLKGPTFEVVTILSVKKSRWQIRKK